MKKVNKATELDIGDVIRCGLNPEWGFGVVEEIKHYSGKNLVIAMFNGKDLFGNKTGLKVVDFNERKDVYKK